MAKRLGNLYKVNCTYEQLYYAYLNAAQGKRYRADVLEFTENLETNLLTLLRELKTHTYKVGKYREFYINEPKRRLIMALPFRDRVVQWWIYSILYPIFDPTFIDDSFACRRGKGTKAAADRMQYMIRQTEALGGKWHFLKIDIAKYFYRVDHVILLSIVARKIKDPEILQLLELIIKGDGTPFGLSLVQGLEEPERLNNIGMPIGNLTSQLLANVYLNELDHFCKQVLGIKHYVRYMDDVIMLADNKAALHEYLRRITEYLHNRLRLTLNSKTAIRPVSMGIQFVGLTIWSTHRTVRKSTSLRIRRKLKGATRRYKRKNMTKERYTAVVQSYMGLLKYNDCYRFKVQLTASINLILMN